MAIFPDASEQRSENPAHLYDLRSLCAERNLYRQQSWWHAEKFPDRAAFMLALRNLRTIFSRTMELPVNEAKLILGSKTDRDTPRVYLYPNGQLGVVEPTQGGCSHEYAFFTKNDQGNITLSKCSRDFYCINFDEFLAAEMHFQGLLFDGLEKPIEPLKLQQAINKNLGI